tara:strand:- start:671 stop:835 length:165 start_codon:yes stop_codon:yes gene_type:complete
LKIIYLHQYHKQIEKLDEYGYYCLSKHLTEKYDIPIVDSRNANSNNIILGLKFD